MAWNTALWATGIVLTLALVLAAISKVIKQSSPEQPLTEYLLANTKLTRLPVISLLLSSSFGLNAILYQVWLGYSIGMWGLIIQTVWAASFWLLSFHVKKIRQQRSLHGLLGEHFGPTTRIIAGICSIIGIMLLMSWETEIGRTTLFGLLTASGEGKAESVKAASEWLIGGIVFGCMIYTILGGLSGNAYADIGLNSLKIAAVLLVMAFLFQRENTPITWNALFPSINSMGWYGILTNVVFSILWQYVDTSTWQSVIAGSSEEIKKSVWSLRLSAISIIIAPGIIGTLAGIALQGATGITSENVLSQSVLLTGGSSSIVLFIAFILIVACMLSLLDGLILATVYTSIIDILHPNKKIQELDSNTDYARKLLSAARFLVVCIAIFATWGIRKLFTTMGIETFEIMYIVIIAQLALIGPVVVALISEKQITSMWVSIVSAIAVGSLMVYFGWEYKETSSAIDLAGTITALVSVSMAGLLYWLHRQASNTGDKNE